MRATWTIFLLTLFEARRRRIVLAAFLCGLGFLVLYGIGFHFIEREVRGPERLILNFFVLAGLYATNFLAVMAAVLVPVDTLSGEIASGVMQTLAAKPIRRSEILLGKWLASAVLVAAYLLFLAGGVLLVARALGGPSPPRIPLGLSLMVLESLVLVTISIAGGTRLRTGEKGSTPSGPDGRALMGG